LAFATSKFFSDTTIKSSVEWKAEDYLDFPNVTICHPNYFSKRKMSDLDFHMHGANALERLSPILALTLNDFPIGQVSRAPINLPLKGFLRLKLTKATIDRTGLRGQTLSLHKDMCVESDELFEARFKVPYTEANCGSTLLASFLDDCSMSTLTGLPKDQDKRACEPWDFILLANKSFEPQRELIKTEKLTATPIIVQHINGQMCPKDCFFQTYNTVPSISEGNVKLMTDYFNKVASPKDISSPEYGQDQKMDMIYTQTTSLQSNVATLTFRDISGLELFFSTLESSTTTLYRDSLAVFL
ncbi:hypothetical protein TCAL_07605, partial [Tigriopus californicus]